MPELARADVSSEPPWRMFVALGRERWTGQLTLVADDRRFTVSFRDGAVVAAGSPLATDAAVRVALIGQLVSSTQVSTIVRRLAAAPDRDELELIAELAKLSPEQATGFRRRVIARRAARAFALERGDVVRDADAEVAAAHPAEVDVREIAFVAARENLSEQRLAGELARIGAWLVLRDGATAELPRFGFPDDAQLVVDRLRGGATLAELEACRPGIERRLVCSVVYALAICDACDGLASPPTRPGDDVPPAVAAVPRERLDTTVEPPLVIAARMRIADAIADGNLPAPVTNHVVSDVVAPVARPSPPIPYATGDDELAPVARDDRPAPAPDAARPAPRDLVGVTIADRYVIEQKLGVGPLGVVYRAHHTKLTRLFAIKLLHRGLLANAASVQRFEREAALAGALRHLNVVGVVDVGVHDGVPFLAMDHADGSPLGQLLGAPMPARRAIRLLRQLCAGLGHAHDQGLIHRDLKPDNVIVEATVDDEIPRIADFGTAILRDGGNGERLTAAGVVLGTPAYMAPEQALSRAIDHRVDLYALGVLAYQMVTGVQPFTGSGVDIAVANCQQPAPAMQARVPGLVVEPRLEALVRTLLEKDPAARPADAHVMRKAFEALDQELEREAAGVTPVATTATEPARPDTGTKAMWKFERPAAAPPVAAPAVVAAPVVAPPVVTRLVATEEPRRAPAPPRERQTTESLPAARATWPTFAIIAGIAIVAFAAVATLARGGHDDRKNAPAAAAAGPAAPSPGALSARYDAVGSEVAALRDRLGAAATADVWTRFSAIQLDVAKATPASRVDADAELQAIHHEVARLTNR